MQKPTFTLIADSGSTKTDWAVCADSSPVFMAKTSGLNPSTSDESAICAVLADELLPALAEFCSPELVAEVRFYGAGCTPAATPKMTSILEKFFCAAKVSVASDMLCAARALYGTSSGIACILGTGANSCRYDGHALCDNVPALGYILGDEGSGAVLGRRLIGDVFKRQLPSEVGEAFFEAYPDLSMASVIEHVYRMPAANRYLASFVPFLKAHESVPAVRELVSEEFSRFFQRNILPYGRVEETVSFVGSIAYVFQDILREVGAKMGFQVGETLKAPFERIERL